MWPRIVIQQRCNRARNLKDEKMEHELQQLIEAVKLLKPEPDYFKEMILPALIALISALIGATASHLSIRAQETRKLEN